MGLIGFLDDYIKVFKKDKRGLAGKFKVVGQVGLGLIVGATVYFHPEIRTRVEVPAVVAEMMDPRMCTRSPRRTARSTSCSTASRPIPRSPS